MPGTNNPLNELSVQKQLLVAESEINRTMLIEEGNVFVARLKPVAQTVGQIGGLVSSAIAGVAAFSSPGAGRNGSSAGKSSWLRIICEGLRFGLSAWAELKKAKDVSAHL